ncbi:hypothetical protein VMT65_24840 [Nocardia sp. CDC153]|uniref:hypothetical protein n=1 Tax=Nocardia sp. CDC153 TaxID=3112167 RepID=UPI002DBC8064|nr:hypothetical protein [Nocardia sp. CDC153]MEC3956288.1 hypothetical protein [Nocardia sp. CDC153]
MSTPHSRRLGTGRRLGIGLAVAAATVALAAPSSADVVSLSVSDQTLQTNKTYTLTATVSGSTIGLSVFFDDNGQNLGPAGGVTPDTLKGKATTTWTPTKSGSHTLTASQGSTKQSITVTVTDAPTTTTPPPPGSCG